VRHTWPLAHPNLTLSNRNTNVVPFYLLTPVSHTECLARGPARGKANTKTLAHSVHELAGPRVLFNSCCAHNRQGRQPPQTSDVL